MKDNKAIIAQERLKVICGVSIYSLISFEFSIKPNINAEAKIKVLLSDVEETTDNILEFLNWKPLKIVETANDGTENYPPLFAGIIIIIAGALFILFLDQGFCLILCDIQAFADSFDAVFHI